MLQTVKSLINKRNVPSFEEKFVNYTLKIYNTNIISEMDYIKKHNKLDVMKLDKWITSAFEELVLK